MNIKCYDLQQPVVEYGAATAHTIPSVGIKWATRPLRLIRQWYGFTLIFLLLSGLLLLVHRVTLARADRMAGQFAVVILVYGLVWLYGDGRAFGQAAPPISHAPPLVYYVVLPESKLLTNVSPCPPLGLPMQNTITDD